jgi:ribose-phosphate pyrophosphokinase
MKPLVYAFPDSETFARRLVEALAASYATLSWRRFPDRESLVTLQGECRGRTVIIVCTLSEADTKTLPLYFAAATARELGATQVGLVAPYLAYMRQDHRFGDGQARSAHHYAKLLSSAFDWLVTVDPHLHRIAALDEIYSIPTHTVSAMPAVAEWIRTHIADPIVIGPDSESSQWVEPVARSLGAPSIVLEKVRRGDRDVSVSALDVTRVRGRNPVVVDDIASSGRTFIEVVKQLSTAGIHDVTCIAVHALFADDAMEQLRGAGARRIVSTNTVPHETNEIDVLSLVAEAVGSRL